MGLQLRNKVPKRRVKANLRADRTEATRSNHVWAIDFVHNQLATGRKIRILTVVDIFSRFSPAVDGLDGVGMYGISMRHGLRKLLAQIVAESGGSNAELKALFGWTTDAMAAHYIKNANAKKLAQSGAKKLKKNMPSSHLETKTPQHLKKR